MLAIKKCKVILNRNGKKYSGDEVKKIREILYQLGEIDSATFSRMNKRYKERFLRWKGKRDAYVIRRLNGKLKLKKPQPGVEAFSNQWIVSLLQRRPSADVSGS